MDGPLSCVVSQIIVLIINFINEGSLATSQFDRLNPFLDEDDEALLSQVLRTEGNLSQNVITGSSSKMAASEEYPPEGR